MPVSIISNATESILIANYGITVTCNVYKCVYVYTWVLLGHYLHS